MRVQVNHDVCQGHGRCVVFAPTVFALDEEDGKSRAKGDVTPEEEEGVRAAEQACPEQAISVEVESPSAG